MRDQTCPVPGCGLAIHPMMCACVEHWYKLSQDQRRRLDACHRKLRWGTWTAQDYEEAAREIFEELSHA